MIDYSRLPTDVNLQRPAVASIVGCGGVGTWAAIFLAMSGVECLHVYDSDVVESHNLTRLPYSETTIGTPKTTCLHTYLTALRPEIDVVEHAAWTQWTTPETQWVLCCVDEQRARRRVYDAYTRQSGTIYVDCGADGWGANVDNCPAEFVLPHTGYQQGIAAPTAALAGALAASLVLSGKLPKFRRLELL